MRFLFTIILALVLGCGAEGTPAPTTIAPDEDTGCPSANDALAHTRDAFQGEAVALLKPHMTRILVDDGGLRVVIQTLALVLKSLDQTTFDRLAAGINPKTGLGGLMPHTVEILRYIDGS